MRVASTKLTLSALVATSLLTVAGASGHPLPGAPNCPIFPADNSWNQRIDQAPAARNSTVLIRSIGSDTHVHAGFGSGIWDGAPVGIPVNVVSRNSPRVSVHVDRAYAAVSFRGLYPIARNASIQGGPASTGDRHLIVVDRDSCRDYELYQAQSLPNGQWRAGAGVAFNLMSNRNRPAGWTSANAAGLPILPGLARYNDVAQGSIDHALLFTAPNTRAAWVYPAVHYDGQSNDPSLPPMGLRVRLKASVDISHLPPQARIVASALKRYGMILADTGGAWDIAGAPSSGWNNGDLLQLDGLRGRDFEVVDTSAVARPRG